MAQRTRAYSRLHDRLIRQHVAFVYNSRYVWREQNLRAPLQRFRMQSRTKLQRYHKPVISVVVHLDSKRLANKLVVLELSVATVKTASLCQHYFKHFVETKTQYDLIPVAHHALVWLGLVDTEARMR